MTRGSCRHSLRSLIPLIDILKFFHQSTLVETPEQVELHGGLFLLICGRSLKLSNVHGPIFGNDDLGTVGSISDSEQNGMPWHL